MPWHLRWGKESGNEDSGEKDLLIMKVIAMRLEKFLSDFILNLFVFMLKMD